MAKVSRKRRSEVEIEDNTSIFDHFDNMTKNSSQENTQSKEDKGPSVEDLMQEIAGLKAKQDELSRTNMALMSATPQVQQYTPPQATQIKDEDLPDPTLYPAQYAAALEERTKKNIDAYFNQQNQKLQQEHAADKVYDDIWNTFSSKYEDYADDPDKVEYAATLVIKEAARKGLDVKRYMTQATDQFVDDVKARMDVVFGPIRDEDDAAENMPRNRRRTADDEEPVRTAGVFGGLESGGRPAKGADADKSDMIKDIHDLQRKTGFF